MQTLTLLVFALTNPEIRSTQMAALTNRSFLRVLCLSGSPNLSFLTFRFFLICPKPWEEGLGGVRGGIRGYQVLYQWCSVGIADRDESGQLYGCNVEPSASYAALMQREHSTHGWSQCTQIFVCIDRILQDINVSQHCQYHQRDPKDRDKSARKGSGKGFRSDETTLVFCYDIALSQWFVLIRHSTILSYPIAIDILS